MPRRHTISAKPSLTSLQRGILAVVVGIVVAVGIHFTGSGRAAGIPGDLNGDGTVNVFDLSILLTHWGETGTPTATPTLTPAACPTPPNTTVPGCPGYTPPPTGSVKAIDSAGTINSASWFTQAYAAGIRLYVMHSTNWGTCTPWSNTQSQLKMALDAGLKVAVYTRDPSCWQGGITAAGPYISQLQFFALDVETDPGVKVTRAMVDGVKGMGVRPVIYSGSGMWSGVMGGNVTTFSDVPLWDTDTSTINFNTWVADYLSPTPRQYGGWNTTANPRVGVQQMFEYPLNGINVDLNSFNAAFLK